MARKPGNSSPLIHAPETEQLAERTLGVLVTTYMIG
jgi:hypothetical protein